MVIMVFGLPGTGKSYFSKKLAAETGAVYLNTDVVRHELGLQGRYDEESKQRVYRELLQRMIDHVAANRDMIVDGTFHRRSAREPFLRKTGELHEELFLIEMRAGDRTVKQRMQTERDYSEADYKVYQQIKYSFEPVDLPRLVLHSDVQDIDEMMIKTKEYLYEQRTDR